MCVNINKFFFVLGKVFGIGQTVELEFAPILRTFTTKFQFVFHRISALPGMLSLSIPKIRSVEDLPPLITTYHPMKIISDRTHNFTVLCSP